MLRLLLKPQKTKITCIFKFCLHLEIHDKDRKHDASYSSYQYGSKRQISKDFIGILWERLYFQTLVLVLSRISPGDNRFLPYRSRKSIRYSFCIVILVLKECKQKHTQCMVMGKEVLKIRN